MADQSLVLSAETAAGLNKLAGETGRPVSELAEEAVSEYLEYQRWKIAHIREGLRDMEAGDTLSHEDVFARLDAKLRAWANDAAE